ncbi:25S rRNA (adenine2142-N1)-methyltransferase [Exophiala xenobiotica]|nr:25S rRNA (adenine2142-N1)-methyltransferase [Exophiala xenobiotica]KAK5329913.1 25S rRNA (adenine2142-N1)-methyltransferase [Exophiala xenobiotica]KAK5375915.1 25S rRNA (adenine2142-N1)-methyltransferase [Exophiala xenobiotica]KAK5395676.1 25S rRNA (adenine2142-N1)-methyltransferase [Exophiala xenobiotica]KAK5416850.1 25S rRNA (adenine2142-N1)-methyltransferase [Exophiala xenobiotica]
MAPPHQQPPSMLSRKTRRSASSKSSNTRKSQSLKSGRPPLLLSSSSTTGGIAAPASSSTFTSHPSSSSLSLSSKHTRTLIRSHHTLQKRLARARARADQDTQLIHDLESQLSASGGLATYQLASTIGQSAERGGDSSRVLVRWLRPELSSFFQNSKSKSTLLSPDPKPKPNPKPLLRILEIGALSTTNALNIPGATTVRRIDLRSSAPGIEEADFMTFPLPNAPDGSGEWQGERGYDVLSLSLVLNYVPDARGRGDMLRRTTLFFSDSHPSRAAAHQRTAGQKHASTTTVNGKKRKRKQEHEQEHEPPHPLPNPQKGNHNDNPEDLPDQPLRSLPCLFLVLPAPTLHNSRYLTPDHLTSIMSSLGYVNLETKTTSKLHYSLWRYDKKRYDKDKRTGGPTTFAKKEINPGGGRNNFCIILEDSVVPD